jgi:uncharacterized protein (DUF885 family)
VRRSVLVIALLAACLTAAVAKGVILDPDDPIGDLVSNYIAEWKAFYPSRALAQGFLETIEDFENLSQASIEGWIARNRRLLDELDSLDRARLTNDQRIDLRLLRTQVLKELDRWQNERPHLTSLELYSGLVGRAFDPIVDSRTLSRDERRRLLHQRLLQVRQLAEGAVGALQDGRRPSTARAIEALAGSAEALSETLGPFLREDDELSADLSSASDGAKAALNELVAFAREEVAPNLTLPDEPILGREVYARKLVIYTDSDLTPERLEEIALGEIEASKRDLATLSRDYWLATYPDEPLPDDDVALIARGFDDLESNRPVKEQPYLEERRRYAQEVEAFVRDHEIATVPERNTLSVELAPESSGPMARIGFVRSAPAFHPNPWTTWYLATIPDSHPEQERIDFWRSFNYSFKRFIVIHELYPGHYMQLKLLRENPHPVRILFPYRPFIEGWATFTERIVLDAGYAEGDYLTRLAQLRKRLENANRAYTSVQAHCNGWSEEQVTRFSIETSLLAPQFAKSLWGRLMRSPMQILTYMLMGLELRELYEAERERLGERFVLRDFMDTILRTGPAPSEELGRVLRSEMP